MQVSELGVTRVVRDGVVGAGIGLYTVIRRNGSVAKFDLRKISAAMMKAFISVEGVQTATSERTRDLVGKMTDHVYSVIVSRLPDGGAINIELIQDQVELALMRNEQYGVARAYILYREKHKQERNRIEHGSSGLSAKVLHMTCKDGSRVEIDRDILVNKVTLLSKGLSFVDPERIVDETYRNFYDGITDDEVSKSLVLATRVLIEKDPDYSFLAARLLLSMIRREVFGEEVSHESMAGLYVEYFPNYISNAISLGLLDPRMDEFDHQALAIAIDADRDMLFQYLGLQILYDRYFIHTRGRRLELPQIFFMRVAMGLSIVEEKSLRTKKAIEFYNILSTFRFMNSTPTLFNSGTCLPQLSSCFLSTVPDDLAAIYDAVKENALLSKFSGGLGNDWTPVRALGSYIKGTNGYSQGVVPFLKVANDTAVAVNQGGKRKGALCSYLELWHLDIEEFLELRKNTGDERRRTHDMNTAVWIPDLFMKRVLSDQHWTLFSPSDVSDIHDLFGLEFEAAYLDYEKKFDEGVITLGRRISASQLWRKTLTMLFETGHPWITFKDPCNIRSPQCHVGVVHSSNLCTEITLNTSDNEIAVCNLGSVNLVSHMVNSPDRGTYCLDLPKLKETIKTAIRMLDNVLDINYYSVSKAEKSNKLHRPVGIGLMGFQDALYMMRISYASQQAVDFSDYVQELISYYAISGSVELAKERGSYKTFNGSLWDQGILPIDSLKILSDVRGPEYFECDIGQTLDWDYLRQEIKKYGMRNSNCMAIAPTATISSIVGVSASIEPTYQNLFVKSNLSGEFTVANSYLVKDLKELGMWDDAMVSDLKYFDGSISKIGRIPQYLKDLYATAFEIDPKWLVECGARRMKWIDQSQSLNIYVAYASGKKLDQIYKLIWKRGLKTSYYLRTLGATHAEKSTTEIGQLNAVPVPGSTIMACFLDDPTCEACQ
ncbi:MULTISPECIES: ribonucleoside-diphosphate reductase subunit alpha [Candidatus Ichthyocystis]|uniref:Ribonucleoside-diphosphate reductase n=2 Tax=Candidatus Ichthyocystis hellenicum TaxID=1561003 RepID=A0A0S4LZK6_9BURK|nr:MULTISPECIES: ribonucleoside-diphosphate reductase subunit alpha [Ichthyocystis]CUT16997.1 ribonucleoside-diphosphate reductase alpha chain [Candidatus Ichthyocystis hellenicum]